MAVDASRIVDILYPTLLQTLFYEGFNYPSICSNDGNILSRGGTAVKYVSMDKPTVTIEAYDGDAITATTLAFSDSTITLSTPQTAMFTIERLDERRAMVGQKAVEGTQNVARNIRKVINDNFRTLLNTSAKASSGARTTARTASGAADTAAKRLTLFEELAKLVDGLHGAGWPTNNIVAVFSQPVYARLRTLLVEQGMAGVSDLSRTAVVTNMLPNMLGLNAMYIDHNISDRYCYFLIPGESVRFIIRDLMIETDREPKTFATHYKFAYELGVGIPLVEKLLAFNPGSAV